MEESRRKAVQTTRDRHGEDFYKRIGKVRPFSDPEFAQKAARIGWAKRRANAIQDTGAGGDKN